MAGYLRKMQHLISQIMVYFTTTLDCTQNSQSPNHTKDIGHCKLDHHMSGNSSSNLHRHLYTPRMDLPLHSGWHGDLMSTCILTSVYAHDANPLAYSHSQEPVLLGILDRNDAEVETCDVDLCEAEAEHGGVDHQEVGAENSDVVDFDDGEVEQDGDVDHHGNHAHWLVLSLDPCCVHYSISLLVLGHRWLDQLDHR